jgi:hypothetical protein
LIQVGLVHFDLRRCSSQDFTKYGLGRPSNPPVSI